MKHYVVKVWGDIEPSLVGPFDTVEERQQKIIELGKDDLELEHGLYGLD